MRIGILSDTHGQVATAATAVHLLGQAGAQFYVHCGDIGSPAVLDALAGLPCAAVAGNTDYDRAALIRYGQLIGVPVYESFAELMLAGKRLLVCHGDDHRLRQRLLNDPSADYLLQGHTHVPGQQRIGRVCVVNPGALHRASVKTVALLDLERGSVRFLTVSMAH